MNVSYPWTQLEYKKYLIDEFKRCREFMGWKLIRSLHDEDDCKYFEMLEELYQAGKLRTEKS